MTKRILDKTGLLLIAACISACGVKPPKCSDESTLSTVKSVVAEHFDGATKLDQKEMLANMSFTHPRPATYDEQVKKYSCEANIVIGDKYEIPITYTSQLDDNGQQVVFVNGISRAGSNAIIMGFYEVSQKLKPETKITETNKTESRSMEGSTQFANPDELANLPEIKPDEPYGQIREKMLTAGWQPFHIDGADECRDGDSRCQSRPEMASCAGTGLANCRFLWKKDEKVIGICTIGEEEPTFSNFCQDSYR